MNVRGWLGPMLARIESTSQPRPIDGNVVDMPGGIERLRKAILHVQHEEREAREQLDAYEQAWAAAQMEYQAALEKNRVWREDIATRLGKLRYEWAQVSEPLGMDVTIRRDDQ